MYPRARTPHATDVTAAEVARHHPQGESAVLGLDDRGAAIAAMIVAFERFVASRDDIAGMIGAGGSGGTALLAPAMRALPVGVPKILVSTVASGNVAAYVGATDLWLVPSMTDVQGLNRISRRLLGNAAHALAGMIRFARTDDAAQSRPAVGLTMFGVTTHCVQAVCAALEPTHDCVVFHAVGTGGQAMEKLIASGLLTAALDITTTEVCDLLDGRHLPRRRDRASKSIIRTRIPYVVSCGALDMVNFGPLASVPERYREPQAARAQPAGHADAHDARGECAHGRMDRRADQPHGGTGAPADPRGRRVRARCARPAVPRSRRPTRRCSIRCRRASLPRHRGTSFACRTRSTIRAFARRWLRLSSTIADQE